MPQMTNHVVIYSGGMDSFTLLNSVRFKIAVANKARPRQSHQLLALSFNYGQRHARELDCAAKVCEEWKINHRVIDLGIIHDLTPGSALTGDTPVPHGHYQAENMRQTVVPGRNTVMLALALAYAEGLDAGSNAIIYYGAHAGDHFIYPDCRPEFINAMAETIHQASDGRVSLMAPWTNLSKIDILTEGLAMGLLPSDYGKTWSCYEGGEHPCGKCGACTERAEAFARNGVADPLLS